ncbi:MAG TPA: hypothetical protein VK752_05100 [Bryobacteraceae bacterium]|nr:hypothetical protein [Bryobacteraceae bacterium]
MEALGRIDPLARQHAAAHAKLRKGMCLCGSCRKCRHRATVQRLRDDSRLNPQRPELTREFPIFAEELASTMRYAVRSGFRRGAQ